jgi:hypothetical protein
VIVVDDLGLSFQGMNNFRKGLRGFIDTALLPTDLVVLVRTGEARSLLQPLTNDREAPYAAWTSPGTPRLHSPRCLSRMPRHSPSEATLFQQFDNVIMAQVFCEIQCCTSVVVCELLIDVHFKQEFHCIDLIVENGVM